LIVLPPLAAPAAAAAAEVPEVRELEYNPRRPFIKQADLERFGFTQGCRRCTLMRNGLKAQGVKHADECRLRVEQCLRDAGDPRLAAAERRALDEVERRAAAAAGPAAAAAAEVPPEAAPAAPLNADRAHFEHEYERWGAAPAAAEVPPEAAPAAHIREPLRRERRRSHESFFIGYAGQGPDVCGPRATDNYYLICGPRAIDYYYSICGPRAIDFYYIARRCRAVLAAASHGRVAPTECVGTSRSRPVGVGGGVHLRPHRRRGRGDMGLHAAKRQKACLGPHRRREALPRGGLTAVHNV
jgi:hypothetical protein